MQKKRQAENSQTFYCLQFLSINISLWSLSLNSTVNFLLLYQVFIYGTYVLSYFCLFRRIFWAKLGHKIFFRASISDMYLRLQELQESNFKTQQIGAKKLKKAKTTLIECFIIKIYFICQKISILSGSVGITIIC